MALEVFKLFGSIVVKNDEANESIAKTEGKAEGLGNKLLGGIGTAAKWGAGIAAAAATAAIAIGTVAVKSADEFQQSLNKLQVTTGASAEDMKQLSEVVKGVYGNNFGESFDDVANSVKLISQNLKVTGEDLQKVTEYAIGFRDSFGYEIEESTRAAKALMDNFGVSADQAYNLMAQGAQKGLDYSGEMIDSISEYSVQFGKVGLSADDMFNIFKSGTDAGAFNLDKIGDAVKEFSIRAIDGSKTTAEGFAAIGMNSDEMAKKFAAGGDTAKEAFYQVIQGLSEIDDPVAQSAAGVSLFGTMWEDLGPQVVLSLDDVKNGFDETKKSMDDINKIQYNSFGEAIEGIKRQIETNIFIPIGQMILPVLNTFANWFSEKGVPALKSFGDSIIAVSPYVQEAFIGLFTIISTIVDGFIESFSSFFGSMNISWTDLFTVLQSIWIEYGEPIFNALLSIIQTIFDNSQPIFEGLGVLFQTLMSILQVAWESIGKPLFDFFVEQIKNLSAVFNEVFPILAEVFSGLCDTINLLWNEILQPLLEGVGAYVQNVLLPNWSKSFEFLWSIVKLAFEHIGNVWTNVLKPILDGIILFIGGVFSGNWSKAWEGIKSILSGIWENLKIILGGPIDWIVEKVSGIGETLTAPFRKAAEAIGNAWEGIKSKFKLPHFKVNGSLDPTDWMDKGMPSIGVDWYYKGGIFTNPTILGGIGVGDKYKGQGSNAEAVVPLDQMYSNINSMISESDNSETIVTYLIAIIEKMNNLIEALDIKIDGISIVKAIKEPLSEELAFDANRGK